MPQMHFYVTDETARDLRRRAAAARMSVSRFLARLVQEPAKQGWPSSYSEEVVGGWHGEPLARPEQGVVEERGQW